MNTITVQVKQEHIDRGVRRYLSNCALALAFYDAVEKDAVVVVLGRKWISVTHDERSREYLHTPESEKFVYDFDHGVPVHPATFTFTEKT